MMTIMMMMKKKNTESVFTLLFSCFFSFLYVLRTPADFVLFQTFIHQMFNSFISWVLWLFFATFEISTFFFKYFPHFLGSLQFLHRHLWKLQHTIGFFHYFHLVILLLATITLPLANPLLLIEFSYHSTTFRNILLLSVSPLLQIAFS